MSKQGQLRYNPKIAKYTPLMIRAGTDRRLQTQIQLETDINALSMDRGGRKRDAVASLGAADGRCIAVSIRAQPRTIGQEGGYHPCRKVSALS